MTMKPSLNHQLNNLEWYYPVNFNLVNPVLILSINFYNRMNICSQFVNCYLLIYQLIYSVKYCMLQQCLRRFCSLNKEKERKKDIIDI